MRPTDSTNPASPHALPDDQVSRLRRAAADFDERSGAAGLRRALADIDIQSGAAALREALANVQETSGAAALCRAVDAVNAATGYDALRHATGRAQTTMSLVADQMQAPAALAALEHMQAPAALAALDQMQAPAALAALEQMQAPAALAALEQMQGPAALAALEHMQAPAAAWASGLLSVVDQFSKATRAGLQSDYMSNLFVFLDAQADSLRASGVIEALARASIDTAERFRTPLQQMVTGIRAIDFGVLDGIVQALHAPQIKDATTFFRSLDWVADAFAGHRFEWLPTFDLLDDLADHTPDDSARERRQRARAACYGAAEDVVQNRLLDLQRFTVGVLRLSLDHVSDTAHYLALGGWHFAPHPIGWLRTSVSRRFNKRENRGIPQLSQDDGRELPFLVFSDLPIDAADSQRLVDEEVVERLHAQRIITLLRGLHTDEQWRYRSLKAEGLGRVQIENEPGWDKTAVERVRKSIRRLDVELQSLRPSDIDD